MSNNIKYGSRILDMGVLLEMKAHCECKWWCVTVHYGVSAACQ